MIAAPLTLPRRETKPRASGLTMVIDSGLATDYFLDVMRSHGELVDLVKFGWATALVTKDIEQKMTVARECGVEYFLGGTLFEKFISQDRFEDFRRLCRRLSCRYVEVSNGTIDLSNTEKAAYVRKLADEFTVLSEVGYKDPNRSELLAAPRWVEFIEEDIDAGATLVVTESRESGHSGTCLADGRLRVGLIEELISRIDPKRLLFEAPTTPLQAHFVSRVGPDVNLGNIPPHDVVSLETIRLGLRADTLLLVN